MQDLDKRLKKVEAQLKHLTDVIKQLANKGVPNKEQSEDGEEKRQQESEKPVVGNIPTQSQNQSVYNQEQDSEQSDKSVFNQENNNQPVNLVQNLQPPAQNVQPTVVNRDDQKKPVEEDQDKEFVEGMKNDAKIARRLLEEANVLMQEDDSDVE